MFGLRFSLPLLYLAGRALAITVTDGDDGSITIDTESTDGLSATISNTCDFTSLVYRREEFQYQGAFSHLASGIDADEVSYKTVDDYVVVTCSAQSADLDVIQYYVFIDGHDQIYLGTYTYSEPSYGELRFIFRLISDLDLAYPHGNVSDTRNGTVIEGKDVYIVGSETRSKYYSNDRFIDDPVHCAYRASPAVHACFVKPVRAYDASSGGPFARDINLNIGPDYHGVTFYMNHGDTEYDPYRQGFHGPYIFSFTGSGIPKVSDFDTTFFKDVGLEGYVGESGRGFVKGIASGTSDDFPTILHWYNNEHQQWVYANDNGSFKSPALVPGEYTQALYQAELLAANFTVVVKAGTTVTENIAASNPIITEDRTTIFQIGKYDGLPTGFLNADKQNHMHLSDKRMGDWDTPTFVVGKSKDVDFPMILLKDVNDARVIEFNLDAALNEATTLRIATTMAISGGRPGVTLNDFEGKIPSGPPVTPSRGPTKGKTHGDMSVYTYPIPSGTLVRGKNTLVINVISGSSTEGFLSPSFIVDAIELFY
ncbi:Rhamnogalacturonase B, N-terminal-domain-containing protein [Ilyonectria robusta]|uniref:Rhamnogalacturonase B, N-terminal-domain-containing protein n=1 Tax=Ilyonectria robusta TaxID=1079257 RepID=UPI001E8DCD0A|nr:Rhamnogalacturonase B, N-terminal-domain-containing protein [Ilyonectria robusta]KAH8650697.1 Rhamnogalacturonase B, N-terminal-domain-containing protein [Ilyonectria robusta]